MTTVVIPLYEGITHLDFTGPHQMLSLVPDVQIIVASLDGLPVKSHGLTFGELACLEAIEHCDILCVLAVQVVYRQSKTRALLLLSNDLAATQNI